MSEIASASINTFGISSKADFVPTSEQLITLTYGQLQELIINAVTKAIEPLQDEVRELNATVANQDEKIAVLESTQNTQADNQLIQLRLINAIREEVHKETGPSQGELERVAKIEKLCQDAPGHTISLAELKGRLCIDKAVLSRLLKRINQDKFYLRKSTLDKRVRYLCLRPEVR